MDPDEMPDDPPHVCEFHDCFLEPQPLMFDEGVEWRCPVGARMASRNSYDTPQGFPPGCVGVAR